MWAERVRKHLPLGRPAWQPSARLSKLHSFRLGLPWNELVQGMAVSWQGAKGAQMAKEV